MPRPLFAHCSALPLGIFFACQWPAPATANDYYVAAQDAGIETGDGSQSAPWGAVEEALHSGTLSGGDRLLLLPGDHGHLILQNAWFDQALEIRPAELGTVHVERIYVDRARGLRISGLSVWPRQPTEQGYDLVRTKAATTDIEFADLDVRASPTADQDYLRWSKDDWLTKWRRNGAKLQGSDITVRDSIFTGISFGITTSGPDIQVLNNQIIGFSGDGLRGLGENNVFRGNLVRDCVKVDANHDDGFQSWAKAKDDRGLTVVSGGVLEGNTILEWTGPADHPLRCKLQGIGMFDGMYRDWVIENNLISVSVYHGISVYGAENVRIVNNTVVHARGESISKPWIMLSDHKQGHPAKGNLVANNIAQAYKNASADTGAIGRKTNAVIRYPFKEYRDPGGFDYHLSDQSPLVDIGRADLAPSHDIEGTARPLGAGPDLGAYETR